MSCGFTDAFEELGSDIVGGLDEAGNTIAGTVKGALGAAESFATSAAGDVFATVSGVTNALGSIVANTVDDIEKDAASVVEQAISTAEAAYTSAASEFNTIVSAATPLYNRLESETVPFLQQYGQAIVDSEAEDQFTGASLLVNIAWAAVSQGQLPSTGQLGQIAAQYAAGAEIPGIANALSQYIPGISTLLDGGDLDSAVSTFLTSGSLPTNLQGVLSGASQSVVGQIDGIGNSIAGAVQSALATVVPDLSKGASLVTDAAGHLVGLADTAANIAKLTQAQIVSLAGVGIKTITATGDVAIDTAQLLALEAGGIKIVAPAVNLADTTADIATYTATQIGALVAAGVTGLQPSDVQASTGVTTIYDAIVSTGQTYGLVPVQALGTFTNFYIVDLTAGQTPVPFTLPSGDAFVRLTATQGGPQGQLDLTLVSGETSLVLLGSGVSTLFGNAANNPQTYSLEVSTSGTGVVQFRDTVGLTADIEQNFFGTLQELTPNAFGTGSIKVGDRVEFSSDSTDGNTFSLDGQPTVTLSVDPGLTETLTGLIETSSEAFIFNTTQSVLVNGGGVLVLTNAADSWAGGTTVDGTTLQLGDGTAASAGVSVGSGAVTLENGASLVLDETGNYTFGNDVTGNGQIVVEGTGTVTLTGNNDTTGGIQVDGGTLGVANPSAEGVQAIKLAQGALAFGSTGVYGGQIEIGGPVGSVDTLILANGETVTQSGAVFTVYNGSYQPYGVAVTGSGTLVLTGRENAWTGGTAVTGGATLSIGLASASALTGNSSIGTGGITLGDASSAGTLVTTNAGTITPSDDVYVGAGGGEIDVTSATGSTILGGLSGSGTFTKGGAGTLTLSSDSDTGPLSVVGGTLDLTLASGTVAGGIGLAGTGAAATLLTSNTGAVTVAGRLSVGLGDGTVDVASASGTLTIDGALWGQGTLTKTGAGTLVLAGSGGTSGGITVAAGTLALSGTGGFLDVVTITGGTLAVASAASVSGAAITFGTGGGTLEIDAPLANGSTFGAALNGVGFGAAIDLRGLAYTAGSTATVSGGTLTVTSAGISNTVTLSNPSLTSFSTVSDGHGGTLVIDAPATFKDSAGATHAETSIAAAFAAESADGGASDQVTLVSGNPGALQLPGGTFDNTKTVSGGTSSGIASTKGGTVVNTGSISGTTGVSFTGTGANPITVSGGGTITGTQGDGISAQTGSGPIMLGTSGAPLGTVTGTGGNAIDASSASGNVSVDTGGMVKSTTGTGIQASAGGGGNATVTLGAGTSVQGAATPGSHGAGVAVTASGGGSGTIEVTGNDVSVTGDQPAMSSVTDNANAVISITGTGGSDMGSSGLVADQQGSGAFGASVSVADGTTVGFNGTDPTDNYNGQGIFVGNLGTGTTGVTTGTGSVTGNANGIVVAQANAADGNAVSVITGGDVTGNGGTSSVPGGYQALFNGFGQGQTPTGVGVLADTAGKGALTVKTSGGTVQSAQGSDAIVAGSAGGKLTVTNTDALQHVAGVTGGSGIEAVDTGNGGIEVTNSGAISGTAGMGAFIDGIVASTTAASTAGDITVDTLAGGTIGVGTAVSGTGISAAVIGTGSGSVSVDNVAAVTAGAIGIDASTAGGGNVHVDGTGAITAGAAGISAVNSGIGGVFVGTNAALGSITAGTTGITASTAGAGPLTVTTGASAVTGNSSGGTTAANVGIAAAATSTGAAGAVSVTTGAGAISGVSGIMAGSAGTGAASSVTVAVGGNVTGTGTATGSVGVLATGVGGKVEVDQTAGVIQSGQDGIGAGASGAGAVVVNQSGGQIGTSAAQVGGAGIKATRSAAGTVAVSATQVFATGDGVDAENTSSGAVSVTANGTVSAGGAGIYLAGSSTADTVMVGAGTTVNGAVGLEVDGGTTTLHNAGTIGSITGGNAVKIDAGTLQIGDAALGTLNGDVADAGTLALTNASTLALANTITGSGSLTQSGSGVTTLTSANSYAGGTTLAGGTLVLGSADAIGTTGAIGFTGGTLCYTGANATDYSSRFSNATGQAYSIDTNGRSVTLAGNLTSTGGSFSKLGAGTLDLTGADTYTGPTTVGAGTLLVDGSDASSAIEVKNGATLGGHGSVGAVTVDAGGFLSPGDSPGQITASSLTLDYGSDYVAQLGGATPGTGYDQTVVQAGGSVNLNGATLDLSRYAGYVPTGGESFDLIVNDTGQAVSGTFAHLYEGATTTIDGYGFSVTYHGGPSGNDVVLTEIDQAPTAGITTVPYAAVEQTPLSLKDGGLSVADHDGGSGIETVTLAVSEGSLTASAGDSGAQSVTVSPDGRSVTITGTVAQIDKALGAGGTSTLAYVDGTDTPSATAALTLSVTDGTLASTTARSTIAIQPVNDAPTATAATAVYQATEKQALSLQGTGLSVADVDGGTGVETVTLTVGEGTLDATPGTTGVAVTGRNTGTLVLGGTVAQLDALLHGTGGNDTLVYTDASDTPVATTALTLTVDDDGNTGSGGPQTAQAGATIDVAPVDQAPTATAPTTAYQATEQTRLDLASTGLSVADPDGGTGIETATLSVGEGLLAVSAGNSGASVTGSGSGSVTISGTIAAIDAVLNGTGSSTLSYTNPLDAPSASTLLTLSIDDDGNAGSGPAGGYTRSASQIIDVTAVNDAPTATPSTGTYQAVEQTTLDLRGTGLSVGDVDGGTGIETVTLTVGEGTLTAAPGTGASAGLAVSNAGTNSVTLQGTIAELDALLQGTDRTGTLSYVDPSDTPAAGTTLTLAIDDDGNSGVGGAMSAEVRSAITIQAVNDAPVATAVTAVYRAIEQTNIDLKNTGLAVGDVDGGTKIETATLAVGEGTILADAGNSGASVAGSGSGTVTISGTLDEIDGVLGGQGTSTLSYIDSSDTPSNSQLTLSIDDEGNSGSGGAKTGSATATIDVQPVNDAPTATASTAVYQAVEQTGLALKNTGLSVYDVDGGTGIETATLAVGEGILTATAGDSGASVAGSGSSSVTITGTTMQIDAVLGGSGSSALSYLDDTDTPSASTGLTLSIDDDGDTGLGGPLDAQARSTIAIQAVNDAPVATAATATYGVVQNTLFSLKNTGLSVSDVDGGAGIETATLSVGEGRLTAAAGDSGASVAGSGSSSVTISGTTAQIDAVLGGSGTSALAYVDAADAPKASTSLVLTIDDDGNMGVGGALTASAQATIGVTPHPDVVSLSPDVTYDGRRTFTFSGSASSAAGVAGIEFTALVDGVEQDLGAATLNPDGSFSFTDHVGAHSQGFITATETDGAGGDATDSPPMDLHAGMRGQAFVIRENTYDAGGSVATTADQHRDGSRTVSVEAPGQTLYSQYADAFANNGQGGTAFVFNPGYGQDTIAAFRLGGSDHDTIALPSSDFTSFADVLRHTQNTSVGAVIHDATSGDTLTIAGISKAQMAHHGSDFTFHA